MAGFGVATEGYVTESDIWGVEIGSLNAAAFMRSNAPLTINPSGRFQMKAEDSDLLSGFPDWGFRGSPSGPLQPESAGATADRSAKQIEDSVDGKQESAAVVENVGNVKNIVDSEEAEKRHNAADEPTPKDDRYAVTHASRLKRSVRT